MLNEILTWNLTIPSPFLHQHWLNIGCLLKVDNIEVPQSTGNIIKQQMSIGICQSITSSMKLKEKEILDLSWFRLVLMRNIWVALGENHLCWSEEKHMSYSWSKQIQWIKKVQSDDRTQHIYKQKSNSIIINKCSSMSSFETIGLCCNLLFIREKVSMRMVNICSSPSVDLLQSLRLDRAVASFVSFCMSTWCYCMQGNQSDRLVRNICSYIFCCCCLLRAMLNCAVGIFHAIAL